MFVSKAGFISQKKLWAAIAKELVDSGAMSVVTIDGLGGGAVPEEISSIVLDATTTVDELAADQPWRLCMKVTEDSVRLYAATPTQIKDDGSVSVASRVAVGPVTDPDYYLPEYSGTIGNYRPKQNGSSPATPLLEQDTFFFYRGRRLPPGNSTDKGSMGSMQFANDAGPTRLCDSDYAANPFTFTLSISDHGFAVHTFVEGQDDRGCRQNWFCIQRAINQDGSVVTSGKAPLFCIYSVSGGGSTDANTVWAEGIQRFTVREADVNAPALPASAVAHTPDAFAVMNPIQQVPFNENGRYDFRLPAGFNTQRYSYPYEIDLIGFGSADTSTNRIPVKVNVYKETEDRTYRAVSANSPKNTGMRLFLLEAGGGVAAP